MPQRTLTLIRHGQSLPTGDDPPLTETGQQQAIVTANFLRDWDIETIHTSSLRRARETTECIVQQLPQAAFTAYDSLWEGVPTVPPRFSALFEAQARVNPDFQPLNVRKVQKRLDEAYARIFEPATERDLHDLVICHGNVIRYLLCRALSLDPHAWVNFHPVANCSLTQVIIAPNAIRETVGTGVILTTLYTYNQTQHLPPRLRTD